MTPTEHDYIDKCKQLIECRLGWKESHEWKNRDYEYLSDLISTKSKIAISVSTLKRIWQNNRLRIPHVSTLNALGKFLDYENWNDFKTKLKDEIRPLEIIENPSGKRKPVRYVPVIILVSGLMITSVMLFLFKDHLFGGNASKVKINKNSITFSSKKTVTSGLPNTVVFNYDISGINFDSAFIQQDWDKRKRKKIAREDKYHTSIYYYPGYYNAKLVINDQVVKEHPLFITTEGWMAVYKKTFEQDVPVYLKNINVIKNDCMQVSLQDLSVNNIVIDKDFFVALYNSRDFGDVNCDNFSFETLVKNDVRDGGLTCQYAAVALEAEQGLMLISFSDKGCTSNLFMMLGDTYIDGSRNDLSAFGTDLSDWQKISIKAHNKQVSIFLNGREIRQSSFSRDMGRIIGVAYHFYGCGAVQKLKLQDGRGMVVYEEEFDK